MHLTRYLLILAVHGHRLHLFSYRHRLHLFSYRHRHMLCSQVLTIPSPLRRFLPTGSILWPPLLQSFEVEDGECYLDEELVFSSGLIFTQVQPPNFPLSHNFILPWQCPSIQYSYWFHFDVSIRYNQW
jgi:hypothetical protein